MRISIDNKEIIIMKLKKSIPLVLLLSLVNFAIIAQNSILNKKIEIKQRKFSSYELINYLENQTSYSINYSESVLEVAKDLKLGAGTYSVKYLLDKIFAQQQVDFIIKPKKILVRPQPTSKSSYINGHLNEESSDITVQGKIIEKLSGKGIAFATISIKNQSLGAVSNPKGEFVFKMPVKYKNDSLVFACLGYKKRTIHISNLSGRNNNIELEKKEFELLEVKIKPKNPKDIVKRAFAKIPENYPQEPTNMEGFYREMTFENDTCVQLAEAACKLYYRPYSEPFNWRKAYRTEYRGHRSKYSAQISKLLGYSGGVLNPKDRMRIIEARASKFHHKQRFIVAPRNGPWSSIRKDAVKTGLGTVDDITKRCRFKLLDIVEYNGKPAYKIYVDSRLPIRKYHVILYIDIETLGIAAKEYFYSGHDVLSNAYWTPALYTKKKRKCKDFCDMRNVKEITKYKKINNKWYLDYVKEERGMDYIFSKYYIHKNVQDKIKYDIQTEFQVTNVSFNNVKRLPDSLKYVPCSYMAMSEYDLCYNKEFWESYNTKSLPPLQDSIISQLEEDESLDHQFSTKSVKNANLKIPVAKKNNLL